MRLSYRLAVGESRLDVELRLKLLQPFFVRGRCNELFAAYNFSIQHARDQCFTELAGAQYCDSLVLKHAVPFISVGPTVHCWLRPVGLAFAAAHAGSFRYAAS